MLIIETTSDMQSWSRTVSRESQSIGFVPTMGALHKGHAVLLQNAVENNNAAVLSIFVNPTQFNVAEDFDKYPRTFETDVQLAEKMGIDVVYAPTVEAMYPASSSVTVAPGTASQGMEGDMRPGHFVGVATVVAKLFNAVMPHKAYFGKKDFQQLAVIRQMVNDLDFPIEIVGIDTVREPDGLALSSRNVRLTSDGRQAAVSISRGLFTAREQHLSRISDASVLKHVVEKEIASNGLATLEYVQVCHPLTLEPVATTSNGAVICVAAWFDGVRLIDNIELSPL